MLLPTEIGWTGKTIFYVLDINGILKIGITGNLVKRLKQYQNEIQNLSYQIVKTEIIDTRWKAELLEQVMKWRLRPWCYQGRHEWFDLFVQVLLNCYTQTKTHLYTDLNRFEYIHKTGDNRWGYYKQIADMEFDGYE